MPTPTPVNQETRQYAVFPARVADVEAYDHRPSEASRETRHSEPHCTPCFHEPWNRDNSWTTQFRQLRSSKYHRQPERQWRWPMPRFRLRYRGSQQPWRLPLRFDSCSISLSFKLSNTPHSISHMNRDLAYTCLSRWADGVEHRPPLADSIRLDTHHHHRGFVWIGVQADVPRGNSSSQRKQNE